MGYSYWFKVAMMTLAFAGTVYMIREMNRPPGESRAKALGILTGAAADPTVVNLCPTRVTSLKLADGTVIRESGMTWSRLSPPGVQTKLDQVAVEKWFSAFCVIKNVAKTNPSADVKPALEIEYVTGPSRTLIRSAGGDFEWEGRPFRSDVMVEALEQARRLPEGR